MKCRRVEKLLFLHAGDDLPERKKNALVAHLKKCPGCLSLLEEIKRSRDSAQEIARADLPDRLPDDFARKTARLIVTREQQRHFSQKRLLDVFRLKPYFSAGIFVCGIILITGILFLIFKPGEITADQLLKEMHQFSKEGIAGLEWNSHKILSRAFSGPFRLDRWEAPDQAGVYTLMRRAEAENGTASYTIDYCGQGRKLSLYKSYPWIYHRKKNLMSRAGSLENVYIAVFLMPDSSRYERLEIQKALIQTFDLESNKGV